MPRAAMPGTEAQINGCGRPLARALCSSVCEFASPNSSAYSFIPELLRYLFNVSGAVLTPDTTANSQRWALPLCTLQPAGEKDSRQNAQEPPAVTRPQSPHWAV